MGNGLPLRAGVVDGLPLTLAGVVAAPFVVLKDGVDLAGHLGAAMLMRRGDPLLVGLRPASLGFKERSG